MANTDLKKHNTFLDYQVGGINVKINLSKTNKNLHYITPLNKYFDAFWSPALASEIGWGYDVIRNAIKKKRLGYSFG